MTGHLRTLATLTVLSLVLLAGVLIGWRELTEPFPTRTAEDTGPCRETTVEAGTRVRARMVTVSVYNAGTRSGLADRTMTDLAGRGFGEGETGNLNLDRGLPRAEVWVERKGDGIARLVASHLGSKVIIRERAPEGPGVTVVVGNKFEGVDRKGLKRVRPKRDTTVCVPLEDPDELTE